MNLRENIVDKQRLVSNLLKSKLCPKDLELRSDLSIILQDISSLINHINFTFERLEYMQDTVLGIINLDQNKIMKMFTFVSLLLMPATLVASFYGMNVALPFADIKWAWACITLFMLLLRWPSGTSSKEGKCFDYQFFYYICALVSTSVSTAYYIKFNY